MIRKFLMALLLPAAMGAGGCTQHTVTVEPIKTEHVIEVKPMEMTINVNVNVRVDKALEDYFGDIDAKAKPQTPKPAPSAQ
jgi:hypothetical protein